MAEGTDLMRETFATTQSTMSDSKEGVRVAVRVRPINRSEAAGSEDLDCDPACVHCPENTGDEVEVCTEGGAAFARRFTYDRVFGPHSTQQEVFDNCGIVELIEAALDGYSCTVFAYGQTGAGKTHTMSGCDSIEGGVTDHHGVIPRASQRIFADATAREGCHYTLKASYLEIYNEQVTDLLNTQSTNLPVRWRRSGFFVENLFVVEVETVDDILAVFEEGAKNRSVRAHEMNVESSRSHAVMTIFIDAEVPDVDSGHTFTQFGKLTFVDLAGSEDLRRSRQSEKAGVKETGNINRSLFALGNVIAALSDQKKREGFVPYRDSVLTKLLMDSLGGSSLCLMLACLSPALVNLEDSLSTLNYAQRTKTIKNRPKVHMSASDLLVQTLRKEVTTLRGENEFLRGRLEAHDIPIYSDSEEDSRGEGRGAHRAHERGHERGYSRGSSAESFGGSRLVLPPIADDDEYSEVDRDAGSQRGTPRIPARTDHVQRKYASGDRREMAAEEYLQRTLAENRELKDDMQRSRLESEAISREHETVMKENEVLCGRIANLERIFDAQADHSDQELEGSYRDGEWHDHYGLRISNGDGTVSVYKEEEWEADGSGTQRSPAGAASEVTRLKAELDATRAREQDLLKAVHQLQALMGRSASATPSEDSRAPKAAPSLVMESRGDSRASKATTASLNSDRASPAPGGDSANPSTGRATPASNAPAGAPIAAVTPSMRPKKPPSGYAGKARNRNGAAGKRIG